MMPDNDASSKSPILDVTETLSLQSDLDVDLEPSRYSFGSSMPNGLHSLRLPLSFPSISTMDGGKTNPNPSLPAFEYIAPQNHALQNLDFSLLEMSRMSMYSGFMQRRPRSEKRPIPDAQKDEKYFERRKRNNEAAKKSRDARKIREDRIAFRAALLEQENSILRAQVLALRDELQAVRQVIGATTGVFSVSSPQV